MIREDGFFCHTGCEALECLENPRKSRGLEKRNDFDIGLRTVVECVPAFRRL